MLRELNNTDFIAVGIELLDDLPLTRGRVESHLIDDATAASKFVHVYLELDVLLFVVTHELKLYLKLRRSVLLGLWHDNMVRLLLLVCVWESHFAVHSDSPVEHERLAVRLNAAELDLGAIFDERNLKSLLHLPVWDLVAELLKEKPHDVVTLCVDNHCCVVIDRRLL